MNPPARAHASFAGVTLEDAVARAAALVPALRERAVRCEAARVLLDDNLTDLHRTGLFRFHQPERVGGMELDFVAIVDLSAEVARGCPSTAWNVANLGIHHFMLALYPEAAQEEVWSDSPDHLIASALAFPAGKGRKVDGGFVVAGDWPFSSGVDASEWNMLAVSIRDAPDGPPVDHRLCLLHRSEYEIVDNWYAAGLKGTGSKQVRCKEVFVPAHRALCMYDIRGGDHPGARLNPGALFRVPLVALGGHALAGPAVGNAEAALELFLAINRDRKTHYTALKISDLQAVQIKVALASAQIDAARTLLRHDAIEAMQIARAGGVPDLGTKLKYRKNAAYAVELCTQAVDTLFKMSGANGLYESSPMQRAFRDAHAIQSHVNFAFDAAGAAFGLHALGGNVVNPMM
jgi:3-hydroxy-9,10-secoandrosta-1,3,5(10)-triene-9,17-dione monooxygenase